jgi:putative ABC transport system permease protein
MPGRMPFFIRDIWRSMKADPGATLLAILSMAIGTGAVASVLTIMSSTMLRPLPYPDAEQICELFQPSPELGQDWPFSYRFFYDAQNQLPDLEHLAALSFIDVVLQSEGEPTLLSAVACSSSLFDLLKVNPLLGRPFDHSEERRAGGASVALISDELWQSRFGRDPRIVGRRLQLNERLFVVIGVMPSRMRIPPLPSPPAVWIPLGADPMLDQMEKMFSEAWDRSAYLVLWARLPRGASAEERIRSVALPLLERSDPARSPDIGLRIISIEEKITGRYGSEIYVMLLATLLTMIVACANVSSLMLAKSVARSKDASIRIALGATGAKIVALALIEGLVIAISGASLGLLLANLSMKSIDRNLPEGLLPFRELSIDANILAWVLIGAAACGIGAALSPAMRLSRMKTGLSELWARSSTESRSTRGSREAIVVIQIACVALSLFCFLLLYGAYRDAVSIALGFEHKGVLVADINVPQSSSISGSRLKAMALDIERRVREHSDTESASIALSAPTTRALRTSFKVLSGAAGEQTAIAEYVPVGANYFSVLGINVLKGRSFSDSEMNRPLCLINETLARMLFQDGDELIARLELHGQPPLEVIGIVNDVASRNLGDAPAPTIYIPFGQMPDEAIQGFISLLVRLRESNATEEYAARAVTRTIREIAPSFPVEMRPMTEITDRRSSVERFRAFLMGSVSLIAVILASLGVYGITAHYVFHRRREMAIRIALGATANRVIVEVVRRALKLSVLGLALGLAAAYPVFKLIEGFLVGVSGLRFSAIVTVIASVALLAFLSSYVPSRRIARFQPASLLDKG